MKSVLILFSAALLLINGCGAPPKMYLHDSSLEPESNAVKIHLTRPSHMGGGANAILLVDAGDGINHDAMIATGISPYKYEAFYVGPADVYSSTYADKPEIGHFMALCGWEPVTTPKKISNGRLAGKFKKHCPKKQRIYEIYTRHPHLLKKSGLMISDSSISPNAFWKVRHIKYKYASAALIGEVGSGDSITWTRPAGKMKLHAIYCQGSCGGDRWNEQKAAPLEHDLLPGQEYYIQMHVFIDRPFILSSTPFE